MRRNFGYREAYGVYGYDGTEILPIVYSLRNLRDLGYWEVSGSAGSSSGTTGPVGGTSSESTGGGVAEFLFQSPLKPAAQVVPHPLEPLHCLLLWKQQYPKNACYR